MSFLQVQALFPEARGFESQSGVGIPVYPRPATARLNLLFLDSSAEQDPGASGRGCLTREEENCLQSALFREWNHPLICGGTTVQALNSCM